MPRIAGSPSSSLDHHDLTAEFLALTPGKDFCGVSTAGTAAQSVRRRRHRQPQVSARGDRCARCPAPASPTSSAAANELEGAEEADTLLDLVALGIVAGWAEQVNDARYLLQRGLSACAQHIGSAC